MTGTETCDDLTNDGNGCLLGCLGISLGWNCFGGTLTTASTCTTTICGDSMVTGGETCDDGIDDGLGCALSCGGISPGYTCSGGSPTSASVCIPIVCGDSKVD